jgi:DNA-binding transcriptional LysR family regulator
VFHVLQGERVPLYRDLRERNVEFIIARVRELIAEEYMEAEILHDDTFVVVAGARSRWTGRRNIRLADLVDEPWTLPPFDTWSGTLIQEAFRASGLDIPHATVFTFSHQLRISLAGTGRFVTVLPDYLMRSPARHPAVKALPVELAATRRQIGILTLKNRALSPVAQLFIECARDVAKQLAKEK